MLNYLKEESNTAFTENGAVTLESSGSDCLNLFATVGALRNSDKWDIENCFLRAFCEDKDIAAKILFFARDIRGGLGERRVFRVILRKLASLSPETVRKNIQYIAEYGRFDDLLVLFGTPVESDMLNYITAQLRADMEALENGNPVSLLAKWLPSINASCKHTVYMAGKIAAGMGMRHSEYRKTLTALRSEIKIIENNLREKDYTFNYEKQPSKALFKYRKAFIRNDNERYTEFLGRVSSGEAKMNTETLTPYDLVKGCFDIDYNTYDIVLRELAETEVQTMNSTWDSLPDYDSNENVLPVIDTSGSMCFEAGGMPAAVALSLGMYLAEHNTGLFGNHFIEFSARPRLIEIKGDTFIDRLRYLASFSEVANTNIEAVFDLILDAAVKNNVPQSELPKKLILISDMEFDVCVENAELSNFENAKKKFGELGYELPEIVFWNVASRNTHQPVKKNEKGVYLISGCSPRLFSLVASGDLSADSPYEFMMEVIGSERYEKIVA